MAHRGRKNADERLAVLLATGHTVREAAQLAGVSERTATRRYADPAFRQRVTELRAAAVERATGKLGDGMVEAADVVRTLLSAKSESVRLAACRTVLEMAVKLRESVELEGRLAALEKHVAAERTR